MTLTQDIRLLLVNLAETRHVIHGQSKPYADAQYTSTPVNIMSLAMVCVSY